MHIKEMVEMALSRRDILKLSGAAAVALGATGCTEIGLTPKGAATGRQKSTAGVGFNAPVPKSKGPRVVVVGGGWSGLTVAKYVKKYAPNADVVLIEQQRGY